MEFSHANEDYLKVIYKLRAREERATTSAIADLMNVTPASATSMIKQLAQFRLVEHTPYRGVELTELGEKVALEVIRHHRLLELYLAEVVGMSWDKVDAEADRLEHVISEEFEDRIDEALGRPVVDCHGDPIPSRDGAIQQTTHVPLADADVGSTVTVRRVSDSDPAVLRYLADLGLIPSAAVFIVATAPFNGPLTVRVAETEHAIARDLAQTIQVSADA
jgi:DtxR family transcriptional regulator, Mn-dependent transcriptional regulator